MESVLKVGSLVKFIHPFEDEKNLTFAILEISEVENWAQIQVNLNLPINPTLNVNLTDIELVTL